MTRDKQHGAVGASGETVSANSSRTIIIHVVIVTVVLITAVTNVGVGIQSFTLIVAWEHACNMSRKLFYQFS